MPRFAERKGSKDETRCVEGASSPSVSGRSNRDVLQYGIRSGLRGNLRRIMRQDSVRDFVVENWRGLPVRVLEWRYSGARPAIGRWGVLHPPGGKHCFGISSVDSNTGNREMLAMSSCRFFYMQTSNRSVYSIAMHSGNMALAARGYALFIKRSVSTCTADPFAFFQRADVVTK